MYTNYLLNFFSWCKSTRDSNLNTVHDAKKKYQNVCYFWARVLYIVLCVRGALVLYCMVWGVLYCVLCVTPKKPMPQVNP